MFPVTNYRSNRLMSSAVVCFVVVHHSIAITSTRINCSVMILQLSFLIYQISLYGYLYIRTNIFRSSKLQKHRYNKSSLVEHAGFCSYLYLSYLLYIFCGLSLYKNFGVLYYVNISGTIPF